MDKCWPYLQDTGSFFILELFLSLNDPVKDINLFRGQLREVRGGRFLRTLALSGSGSGSSRFFLQREKGHI